MQEQEQGEEETKFTEIIGKESGIFYDCSKYSTEYQCSNMKLRNQFQAKQYNIMELQDTQHHQKMTILGQELSNVMR